MVTRVLALLTFIATTALLGDAAQVLCFGEDGHAALERLVSDEHLGTPTVPHGETLLPTQRASPDGVHVDVSVGDAGVKERVVTAIPSPTGDHAARSTEPTAAVLPAVRAAEAPSLCALRTTVLRT